MDREELRKEAEGIVWKSRNLDLTDNSFEAVDAIVALAERWAEERVEINSKLDVAYTDAVKIVAGRVANELEALKAKVREYQKYLVDMVYEGSVVMEMPDDVREKLRCMESELRGTVG